MFPVVGCATERYLGRDHDLRYGHIRDSTTRVKTMPLRRYPADIHVHNGWNGTAINNRSMVVFGIDLFYFLFLFSNCDKMVYMCHIKSLMKRYIEVTKH
jgi:hypothetical protein